MKGQKGSAKVSYDRTSSNMAKAWNDKTFGIRELRNELLKAWSKNDKELIQAIIQVGISKGLKLSSFVPRGMKI